MRLTATRCYTPISRVSTRVARVIGKEIIRRRRTACSAVKRLRPGNEGDMVPLNNSDGLFVSTRAVAVKRGKETEERERRVTRAQERHTGGDR